MMKRPITTEDLQHKGLPFECNNCGQKPSLADVLENSGQCHICGDEVIAYTVDTAELIRELQQGVEKALSPAEASSDKKYRLSVVDGNISVELHQEPKEKTMEKAQGQDFYFGQPVRAFDLDGDELNGPFVFMEKPPSFPPGHPYRVCHSSGTVYAARIEPIPDTPHAMVPLGPNKELVRVEPGKTKIWVRDWEADPWTDGDFVLLAYVPGGRWPWRTTDGRSFMYACIPPAKKPKIADNEEIWRWSGACWHQAHFAGWSSEGPLVYVGDHSKWTSGGTAKVCAKIKTQDGQIWPPET